MYGDRELVRQRHLLRGVVQGVGMRPFLSRAASKCGVSGFCVNDVSCVELEVQGFADAVAEFELMLVHELPPLAQVIGHDVTSCEVVPGEEGFEIRASTRSSGSAATFIPPDVAMCDDCAREMADPRNRRYRYPFITCTNCGPRLSIIESLPYDRPATTLKVFPLCPECEREYTDPADRRFHAQPISCPACGPRVWLTDKQGNQLCEGEDVWATVHELFDAGKIVAVRGIGGFHLMCDARCPSAVHTLRQRKRRGDKPFAVMVPDVAEAQKWAKFSPEQLEVLCSPARPIVVAPVCEGVGVADIAPGLNEVGVMVAYSPLHVLVVDRPVVATSGNVAGEPICFSNEAALAGLGDFADAFVLHDREIHVPVEDSVVVGSRLVRRSRGLAPIPFRVPVGNGLCVLAVGGELKNTAALAVGEVVHVSAHVGDMGSLAALEAFEKMVAQMVSIRGVRVDVVACDAHPGYSTSAWASRFADRHDVPLVQVQHHHAHALSLLAEHGRVGSLGVVIACDGTGFGSDGSVWGGEVLIVERTGGFRRWWHIPEFPLVGGDRAVQFPWRVSQGVAHAVGVDVPVPEGVDPQETQLVASQLSSGMGVVSTSSAGRLFDAAASIIGLIHEVSFEGQAAMMLQQHASAPSSAINVGEGLKDLVEMLSDSRLDSGVRAWLFHEWLARVCARAVVSAIDALMEDDGEQCSHDNLPVVGVTGGCAVNGLFIQRLRHHLPYPLLEHSALPCTDGGISVGQAVAARLVSSFEEF
ncbi:carbamoyltransferase HypF [Corynebacterium felinum]|uniref:Carbamoyltransferase n=1 Tax=Corynebacterium felinum TaxID=131318 RepID=A0ABU2B8D2_9CORY|nr:carbamoyltransferase HypF [Corynebacterium felinum]MDF5820236.1 carbamoyltransferase HypF [Corynebacterium felinum]MDR7354877.1 hydrogenase maturation protein HypF [Corynebacterium felinum]WJY94237.1 Carbamoyltransferase HypF [Corynebacterium felinum]